MVFALLVRCHLPQLTIGVKCRPSALPLRIFHSSRTINRCNGRIRQCEMVSSADALIYASGNCILHRSVHSVSVPRMNVANSRCSKATRSCQRTAELQIPLRPFIAGHEPLVSLNAGCMLHDLTDVLLRCMQCDVHRL